MTHTVSMLSDFRRSGANGAAPVSRPNYNLTSEQRVLGLLMRVPDGSLRKQLTPALESGDFYQHINGIVFDAIDQLVADGRLCDAVSVSEYLEQGEASTKTLFESAGGLRFLVDLADDIGIAREKVCELAQSIVDHAVDRRIREILADPSVRVVDLLPQFEAELARVKVASAAAGHTLALQSLQEFVTQPTGAAQIRGIDPGNALVLIFGPPKGGKTFSVCDLTMHAAHGLDWHGFRIKKPLRVAYLAGEGIRGLRVRLKAWLEHHDNVACEDRFKLLPVSLSLPMRTPEIIALLRDFKPDIVVTDTLNAYFGIGDENKTQDMTVFVTAIRQLRDALQCSVYVIHHTGHGDSSRERGSIALRGAVDVLIQVAKDEGGSGLVGFQVIDSRDLDKMEAPLSLRLVAHPTDWIDEDGQPMVTCIVQGADQPVSLPGRGSKPLGGAQAKVLQAAQSLAKEIPTNGNGEVMLARHEVAKRAREQHSDLSRQSISSAWEGLHNRKLIRLVEPGSLAIRVKP